MTYATARRRRYAALYEIAREQNGVFTAKQAVKAGFDARNHTYHVKAGYWEKEHRGIYRLVQFPYELDTHYTVWSLWSCNRQGKIQGIYSHETALSIYDLSDVNPAKIRMTVPPTFRKGKPIPEVLRLHKGHLKPRDCRVMRGYMVTTPTRTLYDVITSDYLQDWLIVQAVKEGLDRGLYPSNEIARYGITKKVKYYRQQPDEWC